MTFTLVNTGNQSLTSLGIAINCQAVAVVLGPGPGQTVTYFLQIPPEIAISPGNTYSVLVTSSTSAGPGPSIEFPITAQ